MRKILLIVQREYAQVVKKKSFIIGIILTPVIMAGFMLLPAWFANKPASSTEPLAVIDLGGQGIGRQFTESLSKYKLADSVTAYYKVNQIFEIAPADTSRYRVIYDSLVQAMTDGGIKYFLEVRPAADKAPDDSLIYVANNEDFRSKGRFESQLSTIVSSMRLKQSNINLPVDSVLKLTAQVELKHRDTTGNAVSFEVKYMSAMVFVMLIYMMILIYGQTVMRSVIEEKTSRIMEVMVSSVSPFQLMAGKLIGLGAAALTQVAIWIAMGAIMMGVSGVMAIKMDPSIMRVVFNPIVVIFFALYLISGYFLYSTLFAVIGSLVNTEKEAQNLMWPIVMCLILPFMIGLSLVQDPNSTLATTMSLIPFFTPTMMMMRIIFVAPTATSYSLFSGILGQAVLGFILVVLAIILMVWIVGKIFRIGILMYGKRPTFPEIIKWVRY